jgi:hypothetical protein
MELANFRSYILGMVRGISELISPPGLEIRGENTSMIQTATKLACGAAILVPSLLLAVPWRAEDASKVLSGVAVVPGAKISLKKEIPARIEMTSRRQK